MTQPARYEYFSQDPAFPSKLIVVTLFMGAFLGYLNETLLNVALTRLMSEFSVERYVVQWLSTGFLLVMGAVTPVSASVLGWFRTRTLALATLGIFLAGSLICAFATSFGMLLAGRLVQALCAALSLPLLINAILAIYPPEKRGVAMGLVAVIFTAAPALGPTLSGIITQHLGWRYLFLVTAPFTIAAMCIVWFKLRINLNEITRPRIDALSLALCIGGFGLLVYTISEFVVLSAVTATASFAAAFALIFCFALRQFRLQTPLLNLSVFKSPQFAICAAILALANFMFLGLELMMPMFMQQILLFSATVTGLALLPASIAEAIFAPIFGALLDKKGARIVIVPGAAVMITSTVSLFAYAGLDANAVALAALFALFAVSVASAITSETHGLNSIPKELNPHGTAVITTIGPLCGSIGAAFFVGVMDAAEDAAKLAGKTARDAGMDGAHAAFGLACLVAVLIFSLSLGVKNLKFKDDGRD